MEGTQTLHTAQIDFLTVILYPDTYVRWNINLMETQKWVPVCSDGCGVGLATGWGKKAGVGEF